MDDLTDHLPAVIVRFTHPDFGKRWLSPNGLAYSPKYAVRYATHSAARKAMRQAQADLDLATWTPTLQPAESTPR